MVKNYFLKSIVVVVAIMSLHQFVNAQVKLISAWKPQNTANTTYPYASDKLDGSITSASLNYSGLTTYDDSRNFWYYGDEGKLASVDIDNSPYLSFSMDLSVGSIDLDRFVLHGVVGPLNLQLRWSVDNYASSLGDFSFGDNYSLSSIDLTGKSITDPSVTFRLYFYNSTSIYAVFAGSNTVVVDGTPESYGNSGYYSVSIWAKDAATSTALKTAANDIKIYGSEGAVSIQNNTSINEKATLSVYSISGQLVYSEVILMDSGINQVNLSALPKAMYIMSLSGQQITKTQKVLIK